MKLSKCTFAQQKVAYLGYVISAEGVATDDSKIQTILSWPTPTALKELRAFLGICGYYRKFIQFYAIISQPLTTVLKKGALFIWTDAVETAFQTLKRALVSAPVLAFPITSCSSSSRLMRVTSVLGLFYPSRATPLLMSAGHWGHVTKACQIRERVSRNPACSSAMEFAIPH